MTVDRWLRLIAGSFVTASAVLAGLFESTRALQIYAMKPHGEQRVANLLKLRTEPPIPMVTGRVITDARGPFSHARLVDAGSSKGVKIGNPVMNHT